MSRRWVTVLLMLAVVVIVGAGFLVGSGGGTDAAAAEQVALQGHRPWATSLVTPGPAGERVLFGLQAGLGAGVLATCLWLLRRRSRAARTAAPIVKPRR